MPRTCIIRFLPEPHKEGIGSITLCQKKRSPEKLIHFPKVTQQSSKDAYIAVLEPPPLCH